VAGTTSDLTVISRELTSGAEEQTVKTSDVATSMQQMTAAIYENSQNAELTVEIAEQANMKGIEGLEMMHSTQVEMSGIVSSTAKTDTFIRSLSSRADQIDTIIRTIDDIADQTHLLALNAAIEAARAGEQGKGFGVVADEVRKLAERTTRATQEIANTIQAIQKDTQEVSEAIKEVRDVVDRGKDAATKTESSLGEITECVHRAKDMVIHIATASKQMSLGSEEISKNLEAISTVTKQSVRGADKMVHAAEELAEQTQDLRHAVGQFRLRQDHSIDKKSPQVGSGTQEALSVSETLHRFKAGLIEENG
jgi:methyl-accepting chemotaxis protein